MKTKSIVISLSALFAATSAFAGQYDDAESQAVFAKARENAKVRPYFQYDKTEIINEFSIGDTDVQSESEPVPVKQTKAKASQPLSFDTSSDLLQDSTDRTTITPSRVKHASFDWAASESNAENLVGDDGSVQYAYAASRPIVACAPLHLCVIKLQNDESITNISLGDSIRWKAQASTAGKYPVVIVKPTVVNVKTNLTIMSDAGRIYYVTLVSYPNKWVPLISFYDPQKMVETVTKQVAEQNNVQVAEAKKKDDATVAMLPGDDITAMDFDYVVTGPSSDIKPVRIFSSAGHTYIQMPDALKYKDAPAIFSLINGEQQLVNYKTKGSYYIVDGTPDKMNLILGAGGSAKTVSIQHKTK